MTETPTETTQKRFFVCSYLLLNRTSGQQGAGIVTMITVNGKHPSLIEIAEHIKRTKDSVKGSYQFIYMSCEEKSEKDVDELSCKDYGNIVIDTQ